MGLSEIVSLQITADTQMPTRAGFGTPLIMAYHSVVPQVIKVYTSLTEMSDDGFLTTSPAYRAATKVFSQNPRPTKIAIGKRTLAYTQIIEIVPVKTTVGYVYSFTVVDPAGVSTAISYTVIGGDTVALIIDALLLLIEPLTDITCTDGTTKLTITCTAGKLFNLQGLPIPAEMTVKDVTADPGIATDLTAVETADSTTWYAVGFDHTSEASANAAASWIEARRKIAIFDTSDSVCLDPGTTTDIASDLKAAAYVRSDIIFSQPELLSYSGLAWLGRMLPTDPGSATWAFKTLAGVTVSVLTGGQKTAATAKRLNTYTTIAGLNITQWGQGPNAGYIDIAAGIDWLYARIQESVFGGLASADKIPYTDSGVDTVRSLIMSQLQTGVKKKFLAPTPAPVVTVPKVADVDVAEKAVRNLPDVTFDATLAGAIHTVGIAGRLSL